MPALDRAEAEFMVPQHVPMTVIMRVAAFAVLALSLIVVPGSPARASTTCFAYVTDALSNNVSVIDTAANTVTATIPVGVSPLGEGTGCRTEPEPAPDPTPAPTAAPEPTPATPRFTG